MVRAIIETPWGFRIFELPSNSWFREGGWHLYLLRKVGVASTIACWKLARYLGAPRYSIAGLKDAHAIAYQYVSIVNPRVTPSYVDLGDVKAWYLGRSSMVKPGSHEGNLFKLIIKTEDPERLCENIKSINVIPAYYGPQRFGILRPSTHIYGLALALREPGRLVREYSYRYPLEGEYRLSYEDKSVEEVRRRKDPWVVVESVPGIALEALQAYIFNRALSEAIRGGYLDQVRETLVRIRYCGVEAVLPAVRLPSRDLATSSSKWALLVKSIAEVEGVNLELLKNLKPSLRPLYFPFKLRTCSVGDGLVKVTLCLPQGAYVTTLLKEVSVLELRAPEKEVLEEERYLGVES